LTATIGSTHGILPSEIGVLITEPVRRASIAMTAATVVTTIANEYRVPVVLTDAAAAWTAEGEAITPSDATLDEIIVRPSKVAGLTIISNELANDSAPSAQQLVGDGLAQSIANAVDVAFFGNTVANGPDGLLSVEGVQYVDIGAGITNTDPFAEALSLAETVGAEVTSFCAHPATVLELAKVKRETGSNEPLLGYDASQPTRRQVLGVPLLSSPAVTEGDVWAIPAQKVMCVMREDVTLAVDTSAYFGSDSVGVRATLRVGFAYPHASAIVRLTDAGS
jgi:HK97 family phage major capsid protein